MHSFQAGVNFLPRSHRPTRVCPEVQWDVCTTRVPLGLCVCFGREVGRSVLSWQLQGILA